MPWSRADRAAGSKRNLLQAWRRIKMWVEKILKADFENKKDRRDLTNRYSAVPNVLSIFLNGVDRGTELGAAIPSKNGRT
jgi:hypothetical protein